MGLCDDVRRDCAAVAAQALSVRIDLDALGALEPADPPELDPASHYLEGSEADVAMYLLVNDAVNFGSGWFPTLRKSVAAGEPVSGYFTVAWGLTDRFRAHGPWTNAQLRAMRTEEIASVLGQRADHELMSLYAQALRSLGVFLGERSPLDLVRSALGAEDLAATLAAGMALFDDRGFYKRGQITVNDLALAGVRAFDDLDRLTIFADNLVPHVLRCDGALVYDDELAALVDVGAILPLGGPEQEIRACAVHACEQVAARLRVSAQTLDHWLWNRGQAPEIKARPRHRTRCVYY